MTRLHTVLTGLLALQLVAAVAAHSLDRKSEPALATAVLTDFDKESVAKIEVFEAPGDGDAGQPALVIERRGDSWALASHHDYPADRSEVDEFLGQLARMKSTGPLVTDDGSGARLRQLEVADDEHRRRLVLHGTNGGPVVVTLGSAVGGRRTAVRVGDASDVQAVREVTASTGAATPRDWIASDYFAVDRDALAFMSVSNEHGLFHYQRDAESGAWRAVQDQASGGEAAAASARAGDGAPGGESANVADSAGPDLSSTLAPILGAVTNIRASEPAAPLDAPTKADATVTLTTSDGVTHVLDFARTDGKTRVQQRELGYAASVAGAALDRVFGFHGVDKADAAPDDE